MRIDGYLKNSPIFSLLRAEQAVRQRLQNVLVSEQVNFFQALTLITLLIEGHQSITPGQLVKTLQCSKARLSQMLAYLEAKAWIERSLTLEDARCHSLTLTTSGKRKANRLMKCLHDLDHSLESKISAPAMAGLNAHLMALHAALASDC